MKNIKIGNRLGFVILLFWVSLCFNPEAWSMEISGQTLAPNQENTLINLMSNASDDNKKSKGTVDVEIKKVRAGNDIRLYKIISSANPENISKSTIGNLIKKATPGLARKLFELIKEKRSIADYVYAAYIEAMGEEGYFDDVRNAFNEAENKQILDNYILANYIVATGKLVPGIEKQQLAEARRAFGLAMKMGFVNSLIYNSYIAAMRNHGCLGAAREAVKTAIDKNIADSYTYAEWIMIEGNDNQFEKATEVFEYAKSDDKLVNNYIYNAYITVAGKTDKIEHFKKAIEPFCEAIKRKMADIATFNAYLDILMQVGEFKKAIEVFQLGCEKYVSSEQNKPRCFYTMKKDGLYDFHGLGYGTAYVAVYRLTSKLMDGETISIIVGKGLHSRDEGIVRRAVDLFVELSQGAIRLIPDSRNGGVIILKMVDKAKYNAGLFFKVKFKYQPNLDQEDSHWDILRS